MRTVIAMSLRTLVWAVISAIAWRGLLRVISSVAQVSVAPPVSYRLVYDRREPETERNQAHQNVGTSPEDAR
jgi:hypothetical protein